MAFHAHRFTTSMKQRTRFSTVRIVTIRACALHRAVMVGDIVMAFTARAVRFDEDRARRSLAISQRRVRRFTGSCDAVASGAAIIRYRRMEEFEPLDVFVAPGSTAVHDIHRGLSARHGRESQQQGCGEQEELEAGGEHHHQEPSLRGPIR